MTSRARAAWMTSKGGSLRSTWAPHRLQSRYPGWFACWHTEHYCMICSIRLQPSPHSQPVSEIEVNDISRYKGWKESPNNP